MPGFEWSGNGNVWTKTCSACKRVFEVTALTWEEAWKAFRENFAPHYTRNHADDLMGQCNECRTNVQHGRSHSSIDRIEMLNAQDGSCALCNKPIKFGENERIANIDHDHKSGTTRGILCFRCNIRMDGVDDDEWLTKAIAYRDKFRCE